MEVQTLLPREKSHQLVNGWGVGCLNYNYFHTIASCKSYSWIPVELSGSWILPHAEFFCDGSKPLADIF